MKLLLFVKVGFRKIKLAQVYTPHLKVFCRKRFLKAAFERKLSDSLYVAGFN